MGLQEGQDYGQTKDLVHPEILFKTIDAHKFRTGLMGLQEGQRCRLVKSGGVQLVLFYPDFPGNQSRIIS